MVPSQISGAAEPPSVDLSVLGRFCLRGVDDGQELAVPPAGRRLLALLALHPRPLRRSAVAGCLWGGSDEQHASWSLRATLHRLPQPAGLHLVTAPGEHLALAEQVRVDLRDAVAHAMAFLAGRDDEATDALAMREIAALERDLLPDWYDEWLVMERERHRQLRLHALEQLARRLVDRGRYALAVHAGLAAVHAEPLRETAHRIVIEAHLAEGNAAEAVRQYGECRRHLVDELDLTPSRGLQELVFGGPEPARRRGGRGRRPAGR